MPLSYKALGETFLKLSGYLCKIQLLHVDGFRFKMLLHSVCHMQKTLNSCIYCDKNNGNIFSDLILPYAVGGTNP